jgi:hypothetical protein
MTQDVVSIPDPLPDAVETLQRFVRDLIEHLKKSQSRSQALEDKLDQLLRRLYGPKGEKLNPNQPTLVDDLPCVNDADTPAIVEATPVPTPVVAKPAKAGHGRRSFRAGLRRQTVVHDHTEAEKLCPSCSEMWDTKMDKSGTSLVQGAGEVRPRPLQQPYIPEGRGGPKRRAGSRRTLPIRRSEPVEEVPPGVARGRQHRHRLAGVAAGVGLRRHRPLEELHFNAPPS